MAEVFTHDVGRWRELDAFTHKMGTARQQCKRLADSEKIMGYDESWLAYSQMMDEMTENCTWLSKVLP